MSYITQLRTTDLEQALDFYTRTLGYKIAFRYEDFYAGIDIDGQILHLKLVDEDDPSIDFVAQGDHFHLYIEVTDLAARHEELAGGGAQISAIKAQPWGREFVVIDPEGHRIYYAEKASG
jgi:catechol 2,3-dioxygenase-like lactoylglutathione lyase family enzyme